MVIEKRTKSAGFTILEVLLTLAILSIILVSATTLLTANVKSVHETEKNVEYTQNLRIASNQIMDRIKKDNSVKVAYEGGLLMINDKIFLDPTKKVTNTHNAQLWVYGETDTNAELMLRDEDTASDSVLAEYIKEITINQPNERYLNIKISMTDDAEAVLSVPLAFSFSSVIPDTPDNPNSIWGDFMIYTHRLVIQSGAKVIGPASIVYVANRTDQQCTIENSQTQFKAAKLYVEKKMKLQDAQIGNEDGSSSFYVDGTLNIVNQAKFIGSLYYTKNISQPPPNATKVGSIDFPDVSMPSPQSNDWYVDKGYTNNTTPRDNMKYKGGSITFNMVRDGIENVSIYSTGDIEFQNGSVVKGILYAPEGTVYIHDSTFEGIIIADRIYIYNSNTHVTFRSFDINNLPF